MDVVVNGERKQFQEGMTVAQLLEHVSIRPERVVVEVNLTVLKRAQHATTVLNNGDHIEIVHFVGGGSGRNKVQGAGFKAVPCTLSLEP